MIAALFSVLLLMADTPATSPEAAAAVAENPKTKKAAEKKICRTKKIDTGSRMRKQECFTATEWAKRDSQNIDEMKSLGGR